MSFDYIDFVAEDPVTVANMLMSFTHTHTHTHTHLQQSPVSLSCRLSYYIFPLLQNPHAALRTDLRDLFINSLTLRNRRRIELDAWVGWCSVVA